MTAGKLSPLVPELRFPEFRDANDWAIQKLGSVCNLYQPRTLSASEWKQDGLYLVYGANGVIGKHDQYNHAASKVIVACRGVCGEVTRTQPRSWITGNAMVVESKGNCIDEDFLFHSLQRTNLKSVVSGSAQPQITRVAFSSFLFVFPACKDEQKKIADFLDSLDALIAAECRKLQALRRHKQGLMQQLFPQPGKTVPRLRFPEFRNASDWKTGRCRDIATVLPGYGFPDRFQGNKKGQFPFYKVSDISRTIEEGKKSISEARNYIEFDALEEIRGKPVPTGTIIFAKIGEAIRSNRRVITTKPAVVDNNTAGVKAIETKSSDEFLFYLWSNVSLVDYAGGVVPAVSKSALENIPLCYPSDPQEQRRIADCLGLVDELIAAGGRKLDALRQHKQGLMQQLFPRRTGSES